MLLCAQTHEVDLCSKLGMDLKREMLVTLAKKSCYPDDPAKQQEILTKYKDFIIPVSPSPCLSHLCRYTLASARFERINMTAAEWCQTQKKESFRMVASFFFFHTGSKLSFYVPHWHKYSN